MKIAVIGAGVSGLSISQLLISINNEVIVFESTDRPGGMVKCDQVNGSLFHRTGGHVFNTKRQDVMNWFWNFFDKEKEFTKALRNSVVCMDGGMVIPYPIENHAYLFEKEIQEEIINDWLNIAQNKGKTPQNFEDFLLSRFGKTLYMLYFQPYNYKVWRRDLKHVPISWLEGKLPMPSVEEMFYNNMNHLEERQFVHSSFYYPIKGGSQFLANRFAQGLDIRYNTPITYLSYDVSEKKWIVEGEKFDRVVYCGNIKQLPSLVNGIVDLGGLINKINKLEYHGTTSVFCEIEHNPYSWVYLPSKSHNSHRIICSGNFASTNNCGGKMTATIEFTDYISKDDIIQNLDKIQFNPRYLTHHYEEYTYPIQHQETRGVIQSVKEITEKSGLYIHGRFAEWEYYNMDVAIGAAIDLVKRFK